MSNDSRAPILIHDRIDANRRTIRLLEAVFSVAVLPSFLCATAYATELLALITQVGGVEPGHARDDLVLLLGVSSVAALALLVVAILLVRRSSGALLLRLTGARILNPAAAEEPVLSRIVENLCIGSGLPRPRLALIEVPAANAYSTGLTRDSSTLVVTRGLLDLLDYRELEAVVAQELSQIGNEDVRVATSMAAVVSVLWLPYLLARRVLRSLYRRNRGIAFACMAFFCLWFVLPLLASIAFGFEIGFQMLGAGDLGVDGTPPGSPLAGVAMISLMLLAVYNLAVAPVAGFLLRRALSRERESRADADAVLLTRYPSGLARALAKLGAGANASVDCDPSIAHLWIVDPRCTSHNKPFGFASVHPALDERIETLFRMGGTTPSMLQKAMEEGDQYARSSAQ